MTRRGGWLSQESRCRFAADPFFSSSAFSTVPKGRRRKFVVVIARGESILFSSRSFECTSCGFGKKFWVSGWQQHWFDPEECSTLGSAIEDRGGDSGSDDNNGIDVSDPVFLDFLKDENDGITEHHWTSPATAAILQAAINNLHLPY
ncbi:hypothetical protein ZIOFF_027218 [Zingiber officinale]|uniref:Uncharacterized protein n=1 Tax=Zingiber officinale TaxID=94328 RepID=A0A8J5HFX1_ZINOF|nr:hypothetical protein ZIOFF_027218 [Zingiber officinale]